MSINEDQQKSLEEVARIRAESSEPLKIETENIFDSDLERPDPQFLSEMGEFLDNPMLALLKPLTQYFESIKPPMAFTKPPKLEHKVRVFLFHDRILPGMIAEEIENILNDGYCCHMPTVVGNYVIMDFSRRRESEEDGKQ